MLYNAAACPPTRDDEVMGLQTVPMALLRASQHAKVLLSLGTTLGTAVPFVPSVGILGNSQVVTP